MHRRAFLGGVAAVTVPVLGGCSGIGGGSGDDGPEYPDPPESLAAIETEFQAVGQPPEKQTEHVDVGEESKLSEYRTPPTVRLWSGDENRTVAVQIVDMGSDDGPAVVHRETYTLAPDARTTVVLWTRSRYAVQIAPANGDRHTAIPVGGGDYDCNHAYYSARVAEDVEVEHLSTQMSCPSHDG